MNLEKYSTNKGSVQHLEFLTDDEKMVFKTAVELNQSWVVEHAADKTRIYLSVSKCESILPA